MSNNAYKTTMDRLRFADDFEEKTQCAMKRTKRRQKRGRLLPKWIYAGAGAAACILLAFLAIPLIGNLTPLPEVENTGGGQQTSPEERRIVVSADYGGDGAACYKRPDPGEVILDNGVLSALEDEANADAYFFVQIGLIAPEEYENTFSDYMYQGRSVAEWSILADLSSGAYPYSAYKDDQGGNVTEEQWIQAQQEAKELNAEQNYEAAASAYLGEVQPELDEARKARESDELERLKALGYDVFLTDTWSYISPTEKAPYTVLTGLLSRAQLLEFAANPACGYLLSWVTNGEGLVNWEG